MQCYCIRDQLFHLNEISLSKGEQLEFKNAVLRLSELTKKFAEEGIFNSRLGDEFLIKILEKGGSQSTLELIVDFLGRKPQVDAILRQNGFAA